MGIGMKTSLCCHSSQEPTCCPWEEAGVGAPQHPMFPEHRDFVFSPTFTQIQEFFPPRPAFQAGLGSLCGRDAITHVSSCWSSSLVPLPHDKRRGKQLSCELCRGQERWWDSCLQTNRSHGTDSCRRRAPLLWDSCGIDLKPGKKSKAIPRAQKSRECSEERAHRDWAGGYGILGKCAELVGSVPPSRGGCLPPFHNRTVE